MDAAFSALRNHSIAGPAAWNGLYRHAKGVLDGHSSRTNDGEIFPSLRAKTFLENLRPVKIMTVYILSPR